MEPLDPPRDPPHSPSEGMPLVPARRRVSIVIGLVMLVGILAGLIWFSVTHTETEDDPGSLLGAWRAQPTDVV